MSETNRIVEAKKFLNTAEEQILIISPYITLLLSQKYFQRYLLELMSQSFVLGEPMIYSLARLNWRLMNSVRRRGGHFG